MAIPMPTVSVQASFTNPFAAPSWTDISQFVLSGKTTMGRQHELQQVNASTCQLVLWNGPIHAHDTTGGRFSPWNTNSPFAGLGNGIIPTVPVRVQATWAGTTYPIFYGYADSWIPGYGQTRSMMTLNCSDILKLLNLNTLDAPTYLNQVIADGASAFYPLNDASTSKTVTDLVAGQTGTIFGVANLGVAGPFLVNPSLTAMSIPNYGGAKIPSVMSGTTLTVEAWIKTTAGGTIASQNNLQFHVDGSTGHLGLFDGTSSLFDTTVNLLDNQWHHVAATLAAGNVNMVIDGVTVFSTTGTSLGLTAGTGAIGTWNYSTFLPQPWAGSLADVAFYNVALTPAQLVTHFQLGSAGWVVQDSGSRISAVVGVAGVPAGLNNIGVGNTTVQAATTSLAQTTAMSYINTVLATEGGILYQDASGVLQFRNRQYVAKNPTSVTSQASFVATSGGGLHYLSTGLVPGEDDLDLWNNIPVQRSGGVIQTAANATSQLHHGRRTLTGKTNLLMTTDVEALELAQYLLSQYASPATRIRSLTVDSTIDAGAALPQMLGRQLLDRITVQWQPLDGSSVALSQPALIEQISHSFTMEPAVWSTTFAVTPVGTQPYLILNDSVRGKLDSNLLGY